MHPFTRKVTTIAAFAIALFLPFACRKPAVKSARPPDFVQPAMHYTDFQNTEVVNLNYTYIDINADGKADFFFQAMPLGEANSSLTRFRFYIYTKGSTELLIGEPEEQTPALRSGEIVKAEFPGYAWYPVSAAVLTEEVRPDASGTVYWQRTWKEATPSFLPIRLNKNGHYYYGWLQMSVKKKDRKLILEKAGLSTEADKPIKAGL